MLVNSAQKNKCQTHTLRCYASRCLSDSIVVGLSTRPVHLYPPSSGHRTGRRKDEVPHGNATNCVKEGFRVQVADQRDFLSIENSLVTIIN